MQATENTTDSNEAGGTSIEISGALIFQVLWLAVVIVTVVVHP